jgi:hypothetical protein
MILLFPSLSFYILANPPYRPVMNELGELYGLGEFDEFCEVGEINGFNENRAPADGWRRRHAGITGDDWARLDLGKAVEALT